MTNRLLGVAEALTLREIFMNINQMKASIAKFRKADLSVIKDEQLRAKGQKLQAKQKGFTLLELLVVIALLAVIATGALIAYENVGDNAQAAAAANSASTIDRAIRTYKAVEGNYPNQWDNLVTADGSAVPFLPAATSNFVGIWSNASSAVAVPIAEALAESGIEELQSILTVAGINQSVPNRNHNESANANAQEFELEDYVEDPTANAAQWPGHISVIPNAVCANTDGYPDDVFSGTGLLAANEIQNAYADLLEGDECHAVVAIGFGGDAAASTALSNVAIAQSPTYGRQGVVNPDEDYSRFIGLFLVASDDEDVTGISFEYLESARLLAVVATDGENIDSLNALAAAGSAGDDD
jgi:prepilin-type N-terminal cleavage/methylation domain-containing protein